MNDDVLVCSVTTASYLPLLYCSFKVVFLLFLLFELNSQNDDPFKS